MLTSIRRWCQDHGTAFCIGWIACSYLAPQDGKLAVDQDIILLTVVVMLVVAVAWTAAWVVLMARRRR